MVKVLDITNITCYYKTQLVLKYGPKAPYTPYFNLKLSYMQSDFKVDYPPPLILQDCMYTNPFNQLVTACSGDEIPSLPQWVG